MSLTIYVDHGLEDQRPRAYLNHVARNQRVSWFTETYAIGELKPNYPVPALQSEPLCLFCGSTNGMCNRYPQRCIDNYFR